MRIAVATIGSNGDVMPFVWLAERLRERGIDVVAISHPNFASAFEQRGIAFRAAGPRLDLAERAAVLRRLTETKNPLALVHLVIDEVALKDAQPHFDDCRAALEGCDTVVCHHLYFAAQATADSRSLPCAGAVLMPNVLESRRHPPASDAPLADLGPANALVWAISKRLAASPSARIRDVVRSLGGAAGDVPFFGGVSASLNLVAASPALSDLTDLPRAFTVTGAWLPRAPEISDFLAQHPRALVVTLGTAGYGQADDTLPIVAEALAAADAHATTRE